MLPGVGAILFHQRIRLNSVPETTKRRLTWPSWRHAITPSYRSEHSAGGLDTLQAASTSITKTFRPVGPPPLKSFVPKTTFHQHGLACSRSSNLSFSNHISNLSRT